MLYMNQLDYRHIRYDHNLDNGGPPEGRNNVATSGCGPCSLCMIVDHLTTETLELTDCVELSGAVGANRNIGTNMRILGPVVAEKYGLDYRTTDSAEELIAHLQAGGEVIVNVAGDSEGHVGLFTHRGHYMVIVSTDGKELCILDPAYAEGKFEEEGRQGKVRIAEPFLYCSLEVMMQEVKARTPAFYLFARKK